MLSHLLSSLPMLTSPCLSFPIWNTGKGELFRGLSLRACVKEVELRIWNPGIVTPGTTLEGDPITSTFNRTSLLFGEPLALPVPNPSVLLSHLLLSCLSSSQRLVILRSYSLPKAEFGSVFKTSSMRLSQCSAVLQREEHTCRRRESIITTKWPALQAPGAPASLNSMTGEGKSLFLKKQSFNNWWSYIKYWSRAMN